MIRVLLVRVSWLAVALVSACAPRPVAHPERPRPVEETMAQPQASPPPTPQIETARQPLEFTRSRQAGLLFQGVAFDAREYRMRVVDQPDGPGSKFTDAAAAARTHGGLAAVNAGFFTPEGAPLGLVMTEGKQAGAWNNASSLGSALWQETRNGAASIVRRSADARTSASSMRNLVQSGPLLIERGRIVGGLENHKTSARTLLLWDGGQRWWAGCASPATLAGLAAALAQTPPVAWQPHMALNLDGGRSSELWVSPSLAGTPVTTRLPWNRAVRNYLVVVPRG